MEELQPDTALVPRFDIEIAPGMGLSASNLQASVQQLEDGLLRMQQADIRTEHRFLDGVYERTITIPPWTVLTGAEHTTAYSVRLERGRIAVNTDEGMRILVAPFSFDAPAGVKRVGRVFEDEVVWTDVYPNPDNCTDIETLEARLYVIPACGLGESRVRNRLLQDRSDFDLFLRQLGVTQDEMDSIVRIQEDLIPMPPGFDVEVRESQIHGCGLFALREFSAGDRICPGRIDGHRTPAGRFINHSPIPNATTTLVGDDISATALNTIHANEEIVIDYRTSMRINFGIDLQGEMPCRVG
jgi:hypothetical protein